jgi:hypothetical protein
MSLQGYIWSIWLLSIALAIVLASRHIAWLNMEATKKLRLFLSFINVPFEKLPAYGNDEINSQKK